MIRHRVRFEDDGGGKNDPAIGYVYGFADAALQVANLELSNENGRALLTHIYESLSEGRGERLFEYVIWHTDLPDVFAAIKHGGDDYLAWVNSKGEITPMGIIRYFGVGKFAT